MGFKLFAVFPDFHSSDLLLRAQLICSQLVVVVVVFSSCYVELISNYLSVSLIFYNVARIFANLRLILC